MASTHRFLPPSAIPRAAEMAQFALATSIAHDAMPAGNAATLPIALTNRFCVLLTPCEGGVSAKLLLRASTSTGHDSQPRALFIPGSSRQGVLAFATDGDVVMITCAETGAARLLDVDTGVLSPLERFFPMVAGRGDLALCSFTGQGVGYDPFVFAIADLAKGTSVSFAVDVDRPSFALLPEIGISIGMGRSGAAVRVLLKDGSTCRAACQDAFMATLREWLGEVRVCAFGHVVGTASCVYVAVAPLRDPGQPDLRTTSIVFAQADEAGGLHIVGAIDTGAAGDVAVASGTNGGLAVFDNHVLHLYKMN